MTLIPLTPETQFIVLMDALAYTIWGVCFSLSVYYQHAHSRAAKAFVIVVSGPAIWGITLWRGILLARHVILHRFGVDKCGCHHG